MFSRKRILLLISVMMLLVVFVGCQNGEDTGAIVEDKDQAKELVEVEEVMEDEILLSEWDGVWNNMCAYLDDEELQIAFEELAEMEEVSVEEAKAAYIADRKVNFDGFVVEGNKAIFLDGFKDNDGSVIEETEFEYKEMVVAKHGNFDTEWYAFEAKESETYKYLLLMPVHGEEALTHFHLRYGDSVEELLALEDWYPTFISPNSTYDQIYEEVTE